MTRITSLPDTVTTTQGSIGVVVQGGTTQQVDIEPHAYNPHATNAQIAAGTDTLRSVNSKGLKDYVSTIFNVNSHAFDDWATFSVWSGSGVNEGYGTTPTNASTIRVGTNSSKILPATLAVAPGTTLYADAALIYHEGLNVGTGGLLPSESGESWQLAFLFRTGTTSYEMMVRWREAGVKLYRATNSATEPRFAEIPANSSLIFHHGWKAVAGTGWHFTALGAEEMPTPGAGNEDFLVGQAIEPMAIKRSGNIIYAFGIGFKDSNNNEYRVGVSTRRYRGSESAVGDAVTLVSEAADIPSSPSVGALIVTAIGITTPVVLEADSIYFWNGNAWQFVMSSASNESFHPFIVSSGREAPDTWTLGLWVYNRAESNVTVTRGSASAILSPKTIYSVDAFGANTLTMSVVRLRLNEMPSGDIQIARLFDSTAEANEVIIANGSGGGSYGKVGAASMTSGSATSGQVPKANGSGGVTYETIHGIPYIVASTNNELNTATAGLGSLDPFIVHVRADFSWVPPGESGGVSMVAGQVIYRLNGVGGSDHILLPLRAEALQGTIGVDNTPDIPFTKVTGEASISQLPDNIPASKLAAGAAATIQEITDADTLWHTLGRFYYNPGADNVPSTFYGGFINTHHNAQNAEDTEGRLYNRVRNVVITSHATESNLDTSTIFDKVDHTFNLNNIDTAAEYGFYTWDTDNAHASGDGTNVAGTDRPTNSPSYRPVGAFASADGVALAECRENYQVVISGQSQTDGPGYMQYRLRASGAWGSWTNVDITDPYTGTPLRQLPSVLPLLQSRGLNVATNLRQIHQPTSGAGDVWLLIPPSPLTNHPANSASYFTQSSRMPIFVQWAWVTNVLQLRVFYCYGTNVIGLNTTITEGRTQSVSYSRTATDWRDRNDVVNSASYNSSTGVLSLGRERGDDLTASGFSTGT